MTAGARDDAAPADLEVVELAVVELADLGVVAAKLQAPRLRPAMVACDDVLARLGDEPQSVVLLRAPAGYGKTTLIRQWVEQDPRPFAWLTIDATDDDPIVLLRHVVLALDGVTPMPRAWPSATRGGAWDARSALPALAADLAERREPFVLVLDDLHEITGEPARQLVERLLDLVPDGCTVAITTRAQPAHAVRRTLAGTLVQLDAEDLRLSDAAATALVNRVCPDLDDELTASVVRRCDGWAAGIVLAALTLASSAERGRVVAQLVAAGRPVADYLQEELLDGLQPADRAFLVSTSVLDVLCSDLCDAVLGRDDSHAVLRRLASSGNLLVAELDDTGTWYLYHGLLRDLLLAELRSSRPAGEPELRRRAGRWLAPRGFADEALRQLLGAGDRDAAATIVAGEIGHLVHEGRVATLNRWVGSFSVEEIRASPALTVVAAWGAALSGHRSDVDHWLAGLDEVADDAVLPDGTTVAIARAAIEMLTGHGGTKRTAQAADRILALGPDGSPWWATARLLGVVARYAGGGLDDPEAAFRSVVADTGSVPAANAVALAQLAILAARSNDTARTRTLVAEAVGVAQAAGLDDYPMLVMVHGAAAWDAAFRGDHAGAAAATDRAETLLALLPSAPVRARIQLHLVLAETNLRLGDDRRAAAMTQLAAADLHTEPDAVLLAGWADDLAARLVDRAGVIAPAALTTAERRVLELLPTHHSLREIAEMLYVSRNTVKTQTIAVYRKLGVAGRSDAVERARELGILEP